jgi:hypothetical protein
LVLPNCSPNGFRAAARWSSAQMVSVAVGWVEVLCGVFDDPQAVSVKAARANTPTARSGMRMETPFQWV